jgi:hypothetical protein
MRIGWSISAVTTVSATSISLKTSNTHALKHRGEDLKRCIASAGAQARHGPVDARGPYNGECLAGTKSLHFRPLHNHSLELRPGLITLSPC